MRAYPFSIEKWYLDCVTDEGDLAIVYCADLAWRGMHLQLSSILAGTEGSVRASTSVSHFDVEAEDRQISVNLPKLGVAGTWQALCQPHERLVYECEEGAIRWSCLQGRSKVQVRIRDRVLTGLGYAERLSITVPPWHLPLQRLRWGRFVSSDDALVWVDWQGSYNTAFALRDGKETSLLSVSEAEVSTSCGTLQIDSGFSLRSGPLESTILPDVPVLRKILPRVLFRVQEHKSCGKGVLEAQDRRSSGWVIHEVVDWNV